MKRIFNKETRDWDLIPSEGYGPNKYLVSDVDGNPKWEDRLGFTHTVEKRTVLNEQENTGRTDSAMVCDHLKGSEIASASIITFNDIEYTEGVTYSFDTVVGADVWTVNGTEDVFFREAIASGTMTFYHPDIVAGNTYTVKLEKIDVEEEIVPIPAEYIRLTDSNGAQYSLAVSADGILSAVKVD